MLSLRPRIKCMVTLIKLNVDFLCVDVLPVNRRERYCQVDHNRNESRCSCPA